MQTILFRTRSLLGSIMYLAHGVDVPAEHIEQGLAREDWPGNVRQLRNVVEHLAILAPEETIRA